MHAIKLPKYNTFSYLLNIQLHVTLIFERRYGVEGHGKA
jgi:hypothetical protein